MNAVVDLSRDEKIELVTLLEEHSRRIKQNKLSAYKPYAKQREFHDAGAHYRERLLMAGNQLGKTFSAGAEVAMHVTGMYPDDWRGRRFDKPIVAWVASETMEVSRDAAQRVLLGRATERGTGAIPGDKITFIGKYPNVRDAVSMCRVRHVAGGESTIVFKSYDQGRRKFQGDSIHVFWPDEEPPEDIYSEGLTRTNATGGIVLMTFTPLLGMSKVVQRFVTEESEDRIVVRMGIKDAEHYTEEERNRIIQSYPEHEREARTNGTPMLGEGAVFPVAREAISWQSTPIPDHWVRLGGIDFGWDHPTAAAWIAWDRDSDVIYVTDCYRQSKQTPVVHAAAIRSRGDWIPFAWPHDGLQHDKGSGLQLADQYRQQGVNMLPEKATFDDGSNGVEAGVMEMLERFQTGRLKIAAHLESVFEELMGYHRDNGRIVKERDDLLCAIRYAVMMRRKAVTKPSQVAVDLLEDYPVDY